MKMQSWTLKAIWVPLFILIALIPFSTRIDLDTSRLFYEGGAFQSNQLLDAIYLYGLFPAWIVVGAAVISFILSFLYPFFKKFRRLSLYLILTLVLGSGIIVHVALKDHWGRPRPKQTIEFGGSQSFRSFFEPNFLNQPEPAKSFPCGHCSMGFYFFTFIILGRRYRSSLFTMIGLLLSLFLGGLLSYARIAQGGHFFSDVLVSAFIMWWTAIIVYYVVYYRSIRSLE